MNIYKPTELSSINTSLLIPLYQKGPIPCELADYADFINTLDLDTGKLYHLAAPLKTPLKNAIILGLGKPEKMTGKKLGETIGTALRALDQSLCIYTDSVVHDGLPAKEAVWETAFASSFSSYEFEKIGSSKKKALEISLLSSDAVRPICEDALLTASCVNHARDLGNTPGNLMTPEELAKEAENLGKELNLTCEILTNKKLEEIGAGAILGVNKGSSHEACLITLSYQGADAGAPFTALVGKGLTFDAGGYNLKPASSMDGMKFDMCGAANVLCALELIARRKSEVNVMAVIGATENKIGPDAYTCNDVLTSLSGRTIEITNTDAEGRLVLSDALTWAQKKGACRIIDMATLTGACVAALGKNYTGAFTNSPEFLKELESFSQKTEEKLWQLPLDEDFHKMVMESDVADMTNCVIGKGAGSSLAAAFLEEFIEEGVEWIHLDIAGSSDFSEGRPWMAKGASGVLVRTLGEMYRE